MAEVAERWQRWQEGCYMVRIPFLCYPKQGSGERATTEEQTKIKPRMAKKKGKGWRPFPVYSLYHIRGDLSTVDDVHLRWYFSYFLYYNTSAVICQQLMTYTLGGIFLIFFIITHRR